MYHAIVLAGGISKKFGADDVAENEALLDIGGKPMLSYVLASLEKSKYIDRIFVVGPVGKLKHIGFSGKVHLVQSKANIIENVAEGIKAAATTDKVLLSTTDIPFLTGEAVDDFIMHCAAEQADLYYPIISQEVIEKQYAQAKRTYVKLSDGVFTGGNLFFINPLIIPRCMRLAYKVTDNRKNPLKLASLLGWGSLFKFVVGALSSDGAKKRLEEILQVEICVMKTNYAEIGMDVDKDEDLMAARERFKV